MSGLTLRRILVVVISQVLGVALAWIIIGPLFNLLPAFSSIETPQGRTIAEYGYMYFAFTSVPIGITVMIWMDKFMDSRILPD